MYKHLPESLTIATRGSPLALWQSGFVGGLISAACPQIKINTLILKTRGDIIVDLPLAKIGGKGLFVKEIEEALLDGRADLAVHSMKDVPMRLPRGLAIGAMPKRGPVEDVFLSFRYQGMAELPRGAKIGTSSLRRQAQALAVRSDLAARPLRGNIATRLAKLESGEFDAIILAQAGLERLALAAPFTMTLNCHEHVPAAGQGALGVEYAESRRDLKELLTALDHQETRICVETERAFVRELGVGCHAPVGALAWFEKDSLQLLGFVASENGPPCLKLAAAGRPDQYLELARALAAKTRLQAQTLGLKY